MSRTRPAPGAGVRSPYQGTQLRQRRLLESERLICDSLNGVGNYVDNLCPRKGLKSMGMDSGWELEH